MQTFHANGKLLITGEYLVLQGAKALAVPLNKGQQLTIGHSGLPGLQWQATTPSGAWFDVEMDAQLNLIHSSDVAKAKTLQHLLIKARQQKPDVISKLQQTTVQTHLEFDPLWGWGSSSTLLHLLHQWLDIDPYGLMDETFGGSGYDIACAGADQPILYNRHWQQKPEIEPVSFNPPFIHKIGLVYLNKKQNSSSQVKSFLKSQQPDQGLIDDISTLATAFINTTSISDFDKLIRRHEELISEATRLIPVQKLLFEKFPGAVKSLGAWGGDFALFVSEMDFQISKKWFHNNGYPIVLPFKEVIKT